MEDVTALTNYLLIFGTVALSINAFFLRGIFMDLNAVKIEIAKITTLSSSDREKINELEKDLKDLKERMHKIEGGQSQLLDYINNAE